jgi:hypothetical protein
MGQDVASYQRAPGLVYSRVGVGVGVGVFVCVGVCVGYINMRCLYVCMYVRKYVCMYACAILCVYVCMCMHFLGGGRQGDAVGRGGGGGSFDTQHDRDAPSTPRAQSGAHTLAHARTNAHRREHRLDKSAGEASPLCPSRSAEDSRRGVGGGCERTHSLCGRAASRHVALEPKGLGFVGGWERGRPDWRD